MEGLCLILGRSSEESTGVQNTVQNTSKSVNDLKNTMGFAQKVTYSNIYRVAAVQKGTSKFVKSDDRPTAYRPDGTSVVSQQSGKAYALDPEGYVHLIMGNTNVNWRDDLYDTMNFAKGLPSYQGDGIHTTESGWVYATLYKAFDGVTDEASSSWFPVRNWKDEWEKRGLTVKDEKSQATRICGSGNEQTTGTCCLYYKDNYYDSVAGVTWGAGDYYKCVCAKCYHCLQMAKSLDMDYVFNKFTGNGPTGGTGENCLDCGLDNYPSNCGPCPCTIGTYSKFDVLLNDRHVSPRSLSKTNAKIGKDWNSNLAGSVVVSCNLDMVDHTKRKISGSFWGKKKELILKGPQLEGVTEKTIYSLVTEVHESNEYVVGINLISTGRYTNMPKFPEEQLIAMVPGLSAKDFRMVRLPDFSELSEVAEVLGDTRIQIKITVELSTVAAITNIKNFNLYGIGVLKDVKDTPFFTNQNNNSTSKRLTYRHKNVTSSGGLALTTYAEYLEAQGKKKNKQFQSTGGQNINIANAHATSISTVDLEIYVGNNEEIITDFSFVDDDNRTFTADNTGWLKPTSPATGEMLDPQKTEIFHVNGFSLNIDPDRNLVPGLIEQRATFILTL